jgi:hypothetical protein
VLSRLWGWRSKREENEGGDDGEDERKKRKGDENGGGDEDGDEEEKMMKRSRDEEEKLRSFRYDYYVLMNDKKSQYKMRELWKAHLQLPSHMPSPPLHMPHHCFPQTRSLPSTLSYSYSLPLL